MNGSEQGPKSGAQRGALAWMARNHVASNLLMAALLAGGLLVLPHIKQEVFPEFELDRVQVALPYPGASPEEVEQGVLLAVEEAVRGLDGVKEVQAVAAEGAGVVSIKLLLGADRDRVLADVKSAVDRVASFPAAAERPTVSLVELQKQVISLMLYGEVDEVSLRNLAERVRGELLDMEEITLVELYNPRALEIAVEVPQAQLRRYGLTVQQVAQAISATSVEIPGGGVKTRKGEVLLRVAERRDAGAEFDDIVVVSQPDGTEVRLGDIATIRDGFDESDREMLFNGKPAQRIDVYRVGDQGPIAISKAVHRYMAGQGARLPEGIGLAVWSDRSEMYADRVDLLLRNSVMGLGLVVVVLGLFLEIRLAFWVTMGIPISFIGALLFLPAVDVSINMISLFASIVTLGMVVDDAIVVGEAVYKQRRDGLSWAQAAIAGVYEVAGPVTFSVLTTVIAFMPLLFVPGPAGKFFRNIPWVVIAVLLVSLVESLLVLPAHLGTTRHAFTSLLALPFRAVSNLVQGLVGRDPVAWVLLQQGRFSQWVERMIAEVYRPFLERVLFYRYAALALGVACLIVTWGWVQGGRIQFTFFPRIDADVVSARVTMPVGTPVEVTRRHQQHLLETVQGVIRKRGPGVKRGVFAEIGGGDSSSGAGGSGGAGHVADVAVLLVPADQRDFGSGEFARQWREQVGDIPGAESVGFSFATGQGSDPPITVRLRHPDPDVLERAAEQLAESLRGYAGTYDVQDGTAQGKEQLDFQLRPEARSLGLTQLDLAQQLRAAFFGAEALREQRGRNELRVYVRRPLDERVSEAQVEDLVLRTPAGGEVPLAQAAEVRRSRAYTEIRRSAGGRTIDITAEVDENRGNAAAIMEALGQNELPSLQGGYPGLSYSFEGQGRDRDEIMDSLGKGFVAAVLAMFALLAIAFGSYLQPAIVLSAVPFGMVGAVWGHVVMGYTLSIMTMFGIVALSGVVVNDSLVLVDAVNRYRAGGMTLRDAVLAGGQRRFRPILLTSLTTFLGLTPMILETSTQARFLIPMAVSLGFGVLFATFVILLLVPCGYLMLEDLQALFGRRSKQELHGVHHPM